MMYPGCSTKSAGGKLQLNRHAPCVYMGLHELHDMMYGCMVDPEHADVAPAM